MVLKLLKKLRDTGTVDRATKHSHNNRPVMCEICCEFFYLPAKQCCKFPAESDGERILKIDQHLAKLTENVVGLFFESQCNISLSVYPTIYLPIYLSHYLSIYLSRKMNFALLGKKCDLYVTQCFRRLSFLHVYLSFIFVDPSYCSESYSASIGRISSSCDFAFCVIQGHRLTQKSKAHFYD